MAKNSRTIPGALRDAATRFGSSPAIVDGEVTLSFAELHERVRVFAATLLGNGIGHGDRVAIWAPNTYHWVIAALGSHYAGAAIIPLNTRFTAVEAADVLQRSNSAALVVVGEFLGTDRLARLREVTTPPGVVIRTTTGLEPGTTSWGELGGDTVAADRAADTVTPDDLSDILFTSGTTGRSKGAMSAHRQALGVAWAWAEHAELTEHDRYLVINPFFHSFGYKAGILACLLRGSCLYPQAVFDAEQAAKALTDNGITVLPGPPTLYHSMLELPRQTTSAHARLAVTGAAPVPPSLLARIRDELGFKTVLTAYGLTEAVVATMCVSDDEDSVIVETSGRPTAGFELRIADETGGEVDTGKPGEVLLRGENVMLGYLDDPAATDAAIDADGWLHTGDIGHVDGNGNVTITDRLKDMYVSGGFNVYPAEVERALSAMPGIHEAAVIGVADERMGEVGKAFLRTDSDGQPSEKDVLARCRTVMANYKIPRYVEFRDELPHNASGKVLKRLLTNEITAEEQK
jgi:acyl-CoA synthetase (AMP-forming)/AMP-acid ligase II